MVVWDEINVQESSINQISNNTMTVCRSYVCKKNSSLVARIVLFDSADSNLLSVRNLEPYPSKDIEFDLSHNISH